MSSFINKMISSSAVQPCQAYYFFLAMSFRRYSAALRVRVLTKVVMMSPIVRKGTSVLGLSNTEEEMGIELPIPSSETAQTPEGPKQISVSRLTHPP